jgi:O-antigen/teichoic acid export membrane protein
MVRGAGWSIGGTIAGASASFIVQIVLARSLGSAHYGVYSYLLAWVNVAVLLGKLEFDVAAIRFVSAYEGRHENSLLHGFLRYALRVVGGTATSIGLIAAVAAWAFRAHLPTGMAQAIWAACALVPLSALLLFSGSALLGFRRVPQAQLPSQVARPVLFAGGVLLTGSALGVGIGAGGAVALNAAATAVALGVSLVLLSRAIPARVAATTPAYDSGKWMHAVRGFMLISAAQLVLSQQADVLVVGTLLSTHDAGLYSAASQLSTLIGLGASAIIFVVLPAVSDLHARAHVDELQRLVVRTVQTCAIVSVPVALLLIVAGPLALHAYGSAFRAGYPVLLILSIVQVAAATMGGLSGYLLTMTGHEWQASRVIVGSALLNLALTIVLTPVLGTVGAALATLAAGCVKVGWLWWYVWRFVGVAVLPYVPAGRGRAASGRSGGSA